MISSIFYFAETEQEYLDNFNRHQVKPYTIVFCKDTKSLWKNGIRYGGNTTSEITDQVDDIIDRTITPLLNQLNQAVADAGDAADAAEQRLAQISTQMDGAIEDLQNAIDAEKTRLDNKVAEINDDIDTRIQSVLDDYQNLVDNFEDNVAEKIESLLDDAEWVQENMPQEEVTWDSTWDQNVDNRMQMAGYWDIDPETGEKTTKWSKLEQSVDGISTEVSNLTESVNGDIEAVNTKIDQTAESITSIASSVSSIDGRLSTAESTITQTPDAIVSAVQASSQILNGNIATAKSEVIQKASEIVQTVTGVTVASDGTVTTSNADLSQQIADNGDAITQLRTDWSNANLDTKDVLEWMYSGLTTKAGESGTFNDLVSAATSGDHSAISNILSLVEKIPTYQVDPQTGEPLEDEHGNYIYATDSEGNIIYQTNPDGSYKYRAKSSLTSAVDSAISGIINDTNSDYASTQMLAALGNNFAAWNAAAAESGSSIEGIVTHDNFAGELKSVAAEDWAQTGIAAKLRVPKYDENGDPVYDEDGNPVYEEISDAIGSIQTRVSSIDGVENVTNTIDARVSSALSTFEQNVNDGTACTTLVNRVNSDNEVLSGLVSKVTGDTSSNTMLSKVNGMTAGVVTTANLEQAVAGLIARQDAVITLTCTSIGAPPSGALNVGQSVQSLPSSISSEINQQGDKLTLTGSQFNTAFANTNLYSTTIQTQSGPQNTLIPIQYEAGKTGVSGTTFYISDGQYLFKSSGQVIKINIADLSGAVFSKVDNKLNTATAGLAAKNYVDGKEASILASIANGTAEIKLTADKLTIDAGDINAINSKLQINQVVAAAVAAQEVSTNKLDVSGTWEDNDENSYTSRTIVDNEGLRIYGGTDGHEYTTPESYYDANVRLGNDGEGWVANRHVIWNGEGDTYIGPGDPEYGGDGIYVYYDEDAHATKIKLQGEIVADDFQLKDKQQDKYGYFAGGKGVYPNRDVTCALYNSGFYAALQTFGTYTGSSYGDYILGTGNGETYSGYTTVDWGSIGIGRNYISAVPNPRNIDSRPIIYNQQIDGGQRNTPPVTLQVKGKDGYVYTGYTGTHNGMYYINGIAIGPAEEAGSNNTMI